MQTNTGDLISVIVPVYNVEAYLERCVNSILRQSYNNLEVILVDDGSTDGSGQLCESIASNDNRVCVIHQENGGLSAARNTGIDNCHGSYICFVDSDDYVHHDYVKYLYDMCVNNDCEISICYHYITDENDYHSEVDFDSPITVYTRDEIFDAFYTDMHGSIVIAWNKMYKRECVGDIRYDVGKIHEDEGTTFKFLYNANRIAFSKEVLYYYYSREDSITGQSYSKKKLDILDAYENRLLFYKEHSEKRLYDRECQYYLSEILANYYKVSTLLKDKKLMQELRTRYSEIYKTTDKSKWSITRKALYLICYRWPLFYGQIKHIGK